MILTYIKKLLCSNQCIICYNHEYIDQKAFLCTHCMHSITPITSTSCKIGKHTIAVHALGSYEGTLAKLIHAKYQKNPTPFWLLGEWMAQSLQHRSEKFDFIIPIPLYFYKKGLRTFNQSEEIGLTISRLLAIPLLSALSRTRMTYAQTTMEGTYERHANIKDAFSLKKRGLIHGKSILIIDDVFTSGATISEAIRVLLKESPSHIEVAVAARTL